MVVRVRTLIATALVAYGTNAMGGTATLPVTDPSLMIVAGKLRQHCKACHGVGKLRFIHSESDEALWKYIFANDAPNSKRLWARRIADTLAWPTSSPPPFDQPMEAPDKDWMPKGAKRLDLASDTIGGRPAREVILETIRKSLP